MFYMLPSQIKKIATRFKLEGEYLNAHPYGNGHINDTYRTEAKDCILQRINTNIFICYIFFNII